MYDLLYRSRHPLTSHLLDAPLLRPDVPSTERTGISRPSQAMVDKVFSAPIANVRVAVGSLDAATMQRVDDLA